MSACRIRLTIDRLVLGGVAPRDRDPLVRGLHGQLESLLATPGFAQSLRGNHIASMNAGILRIPTGAGGVELGKMAAQRLVHRIRG